MGRLHTLALAAITKTVIGRLLLVKRPLGRLSSGPPEIAVGLTFPLLRAMIVVETVPSKKLIIRDPPRSFSTARRERGPASFQAFHAKAETSPSTAPTSELVVIDVATTMIIRGRVGRPRCFTQVAWPASDKAPAFFVIIPRR